MKIITKIFLFVLLVNSSSLLAQTPGFNYQALILNTEKIQIPGSDIESNQLPLALEEVTFKFTITRNGVDEYIETQTVTTDKNGMVSLIVGEGVPVFATFDDILWNGQLKHLNVDMRINKNNGDYVFLDAQKLLYMPHPIGTVESVTSIGELEPPFINGQLIWTQEFDGKDNPTLLIWNGAEWKSVNSDFDPENELGLVVALNDADRDNIFGAAVMGDQVWNQECNCLQVFNGSAGWVSIRGFKISNGLHRDGDNLKLGGTLNEATEIVTSNTNTLSIKGVLESTSVQDSALVVEPNTGIIRKRAIPTVEEVIIVATTDGQIRFNPPQQITTPEKLNVYRNGVLVEFTVVNNTTIQLENEATCYQGDEVRIVQII